eukprot:g3725.t1
MGSKKSKLAKEKVEEEREESAGRDDSSSAPKTTEYPKKKTIEEVHEVEEKLPNVTTAKNPDKEGAADAVDSPRQKSLKRNDNSRHRSDEDRPRDTQDRHEEEKAETSSEEGTKSTFDPPARNRPKSPPKKEKCRSGLSLALEGTHRQRKTRKQKMEDKKKAAAFAKKESEKLSKLRNIASSSIEERMMTRCVMNVPKSEIDDRMKKLRESMNAATVVALRRIKKRESSQNLNMSKPVEISLKKCEDKSSAPRATPEEVRIQRRSRKRSVLRKRGINRLLSMEAAKKVRAMLKKRQGKTMEVDAPMMTYDDLAKYAPRTPPDCETPSPTCKTHYWMAQDSTTPTPTPTPTPPTHEASGHK